MTTTAYLAGPMTGIKLLNWPLFFKVAKMLREAGWGIVNPAEGDIIDGHDPTVLEEANDTRPQQLRGDFKLIINECQVVIFLPDWRASEGARAECLLAHLSGMQLYEILLGRQHHSFKLMEISPQPQVVLQA